MDLLPLSVETRGDLSMRPGSSGEEPDARRLGRSGDALYSPVAHGLDMGLNVRRCM